MPIAWQGKSVGSVDVHVADQGPLQGKVVVVVKVTEGGFGSPVLGSGTNTQLDEAEQPRSKPPTT